MSSPPVASSIDEGLDRKTLKTLRQRFLQVNAARLERARMGLGIRQQLFLDLLPLLFHVNHPMLPGYVSHQTPAGLSDYNPDRADIGRAQRVARSFTWRRQPTLEREIQALFLMGSCGTVGQTDRSDIDIWVCHGPELDAERLALLQQKAEAISAWASTLGLQAHCFLMEGQKFRRGERAALSGEDCGSSQHYLLLDEFYRTGLLLAGQVPIWWLVPPDEEPHYNYYTETLRRKRFVRPGETLDFGSVAQIPAGEFIGAGIWQLYKAIDSPYKSALKLLLTEVYASQYPAVEPLSTCYKRLIHRDQLDIDELDPYVMVYRQLERYLLQRQEHMRLELVRRCFYFKVGKALSRGPGGRSKSWQRLLLERLVAEWNWPSEQLAHLDARHRWKAAQVMAEQKAMVRELTHSYRFLVDFARRSQTTALMNSQEMATLGRKLFTAFERKAGKVEWVNPGIAPDLSEEVLSFYPVREAGPARDAGRGWAVTSESPPPRDLRQATPLKRERDLVALLVWCHVNGLLTTNTRLQIAEGSHGVSEFELGHIARALRQSLPVLGSGLHGDDQERFTQANRIVTLQLFINVGMNPLEQLHNRGVERLSSQTDSLVYSGMRENLVLAIDQVQVNSWGDISTRHFRGENALLDCLQDYLNRLPPGQHPSLPTLDVRCFCPSRAAAIASRVEELFQDLIACYYSGVRSAASRYVLEIQRRFHVLQCAGERATVYAAPDYPALVDLLGQHQPEYSPIVLDRYCLGGSVLAAIAMHCRADTVQVFYRRSTPATAELFVLDERGSLYCLTTPFHDERSLLHPLHQFIQATLFRQRGDGSPLPGSADPDTLPGGIFYYELLDTAGGIRGFAREPSALPGAGLNVQAIAEPDGDGELAFTIHCDTTEFSSLEWGEQLFDAVARHILERRRGGGRYPCYITDLDLSRCEDAVHGPLQTVYYLRYKEQLELALNAAMAGL